MNGGTGSTLPVRNPITRPVSFHSLSEHSSNNQAYLSPYFHRRPRTPRSSPLAGPSLSSDQVDGEGKDEEGSQKPRYRPNRISSTPDMAARTQSLYDPDTSSATSIGIVVSPPPIPNSSASSSSDEGDKEKESKEGTEDGSRLRNLTKRLSMISTSSSLTTTETDNHDQKTKKRRSGLMMHSASTPSLASTSSSRTARTDRTSQTAPPMPTIPRWALNAMREEAGIAKRNMKYGHRRGTSHDHASTSSAFPPLPNQLNPRGAPLSASGLSNQSRNPSVSRDPKENWMSVTDPIPKFSRLGLGGDAVVLPVKKKESLARVKSSTSIKSTKSTSTISQSAATRCDSDSMTRTEPSPGKDSNSSSNVTTSDANRKEEGARKRSSSIRSLKAMIPKISVSSATESENVAHFPPPINQPNPGPAPVPNSHTITSASNDSESKTPKMTAFPPMSDIIPNRRRSATLRDSVLPRIDENQSPEIEARVPRDMKSQDTQKARARRKSIKQIVMRITTAPLVAGEKLKFGSIHNTPSTPVVVLPRDKLMPLDTPPATLFSKSASSSVPSLPFTKENSDPTRNQGDARGGKRFKGIKKRWNAVLETVRR